ncbi:juvenile hormone acid O-methyltransferase-like [Haematobia irritans]|uniref:juvenile hormone acid O-methyltransferase-like n=1 Tax=Haematobia irritans TaxID=7368 RepID=UPI003F502B7A
MNRPGLYHESHAEVKRDSALLLKEYFAKLNWKDEGGESFCDVGTGPGDVSFGYIYPNIPSNCGKIVFSDISQDMLDYMKTHYEIPEKCELKILDIATKNDLPMDMEGKFDHVTSMLVMHWVEDSRMALRNIYKLLRPQGGDCFMTFFSYNNIFAANYYMDHLSPKWSQYIEKGKCFVNPLHFSKDAVTEFASLMKEEGFQNVSVKLKPVTYFYDNLEKFKENIMPVCAALNFIPKSLHTEFMNDFIDVMAKCGAQHRGLNEVDCKYQMTADMIVAFGDKSTTNGHSLHSG